MPDYIVRISAASKVVDAKMVERLVTAKNQAQAVGHVVKDTIGVELAGTQDIIRLAKAGVELEQAE